MLRVMHLANPAGDAVSPTNGQKTIAFITGQADDTGASGGDDQRTGATAPLSNAFPCHTVDFWLHWANNGDQDRKANEIRKQNTMQLHSRRSGAPVRERKGAFCVAVRLDR